MLGTSSQTVEIPGNLTTNGVFSISPSTTLDIGATNTTVSIPGSISVGSATNGLTNNIYGTYNMIYGSNTNTFQASSNNFIATNNFTGPTIFNSGFKCGTQNNSYNLFMGLATYVSNSTGSNTLVPYIGDSTYGDSTAVYQLDQSISNVQAMFISPNDTNICMWYASMIGTNQANIACVNLTSGNKTLPTTIGYMCFATV